MRAKRLLEEGQQGRAKLSHCPTNVMVADAMTKLATSEVIQVLIDAMEGHLATSVVAHATSTTPGPRNSGDIAGYGPLTTSAITTSTTALSSVVITPLATAAFATSSLPAPG